MREISSRVKGDESTIEISGTEEEINGIRAMLLGKHWIIGGSKGKLLTVDYYHQLPPPEDDPLIPPKWQTEFGSLPDRFAPDLQEQMPDDCKGGWCSPSFYMSHIINAKTDMPKIQDWGFECLRSRRGDDGKYWEVWYLPGSWSAKGELKRHIETLSKDMAWEKKTESICHWMAQRVIFGSLNVVVQRMALANSD